MQWAKPQTRVLVQDDDGDRLLARLPALSFARALPTLLEALALWSSSPLHVVLCVDEMFDWQRNGLPEVLDIATKTLFDRVEVMPACKSRHAVAHFCRCWADLAFAECARGVSLSHANEHAAISARSFHGSKHVEAYNSEVAGTET